MMELRESGIMLPVFSLPGAYGIGTLGAAAHRFIDFLAECGQRYWQILPLVPSGTGASPYMSPSSFAGNPLLIDLDLLAQDGLLTAEELRSARYYEPDRVDYDWLFSTRLPLLRTAWSRVRKEIPLPEDSPELEEYCLFAAKGSPNEDERHFQRFLQAVFFRQWFQLKHYANEKGIRIIGDMPIYVSADSAEVWSRPELFQLKHDLSPSAVAGVPPDAFSSDGQFWGNPLYNWKTAQPSLFAWWTRRMGWAGRLYDVVRIDHFRGFHTYWSIPPKAKTALDGHWEHGPGMALMQHWARELPDLSLIAEDLGDLDMSALDFIRNSGIPGMKVLVYAFDPVGESAYLPHNCPPNSVIYTSTHDTPTFAQWLLEDASPAERDYAVDYLQLRSDEGWGWGVVRGAWSSPSRLAMAPLQDILGLGGDSRMNTPGTVSKKNWSWRVREEAFNAGVAARLRHITRVYRRLQC